MYKKILIFTVAVLLVLGAVQPAMAAGPLGTLRSGIQGLVPAKTNVAWQPLNQTLSDLRLQRTKTVVISGIDAAIDGLGAAENGIDRSKLTDGQKAGLKAQIEANITWFEGKKQDVQASKDVAGALQNAKQASERWNEVFPGFKKEIGLMACDNFDAELTKARQATAIVSSKIASLKAQGKDTGNLEKALASYNGHIDGASRDVANARSDFNGIGGPSDGHFAAGLKQLGSAQKEMNGGYSDLKAIYRLLLGNSVKTT